MSMDSHIRRGHPILFGLLLLLAIVEGCISAWLTSKYETNAGAAFSSLRSRTHLLLFTSWWTALGSALFILFFLFAAGGVLTSVASHGIFLAITWVFWLAGAIAITASLDGGINCSNDRRNVIYCNQLNALLGFAWASWIITTILLFAVLLRGILSLRRGEGARGQLTVA
ncbi:hypothetical protein JB92DRAFT_2809819 [Gautieria morchelliformis]|nr:hypothetical protein JB92DRAFT_2809819 [Gautieria morchelliformis]